MKRVVRLLRDERGFTLIELIMVCAYMGVVVGGITVMMLSGSHAALNLNNRFSAQETARLALSTFRSDAHTACAASVAADGKSVTLSVPVPSGTTVPDPTQICGTTTGATLNKVIYCVLTSPTASTEYALYRSTSSTCTSSSTVIADDIVNNLSGFTNYFSWPGKINYGELQVVDVDFGVNLPSGSTGTTAPYRLTERIALRQTVWNSTSNTACSTSVPCTLGPCTVSGGCYPPKIS